jgi:branched-chain amino acid transport system substrate-binding protein
MQKNQGEKMKTRRAFLAGAAASAALAGGVIRARADTLPGVTDKEIKIGQTMPYSGPASAYGVIGKTEAAYFKWVNEQGGVNGRMINLISLDDGYSPPKTVEQTRRLVEQEQVAFLFNSLGTGPCLATREYLNQNQIPQLFVATGAAAFSDPGHYKWTVGFQPNYQTEARIFGKHILATKPDAKVAVLYQNDGFGKDYLAGLKEGLGLDRAGMVIKDASYETSEPTVDSQVAALQGSGADVFLIAATPKFAAQAIRKSYDLGWSATRYVTDVSLSIATVMKAAGFEKAKGLITANYGKDASDPRWKDDVGLRQYKDFIDNRMTARDYVDSNAIYGYDAAICIVHVLKECGDDLSRQNILRRATSIENLALPMLLPGVQINTSPTNYSPIRQMQLQRFNGLSWELFGDLLQG